jgi:hypothetical protein
MMAAAHQQKAQLVGTGRGGKGTFRTCSICKFYGKGFDSHRMEKPCQKNESWQKANLVDIDGMMLCKGVANLSPAELKILLSRQVKDKS